MGKATVTLVDGLMMGDEPQRNATLRELKAGDIIKASQDSERVVQTAAGVELVPSPSLLGALTLCAHIESIGEIPGPLTIDQLKKLSAVDLELLQTEADTLTTAAAIRATSAATKRAPLEVAQRGRDEGVGTNPGGTGGDGVHARELDPS